MARRTLLWNCIYSRLFKTGQDDVQSVHSEATFDPFLCEKRGNRPSRPLRTASVPTGGSVGCHPMYVYLPLYLRFNEVLPLFIYKLLTFYTFSYPISGRAECGEDESVPSGQQRDGPRAGARRICRCVPYIQVVALLVPFLVYWTIYASLCTDSLRTRVSCMALLYMSLDVALTLHSHLW